MENSITTYKKIIEFYLKNDFLLDQELHYRKQIGKTRTPITINKLLTPIPFNEADSIHTVITSQLETMPPQQKEYVHLRYHKNCTYDVICGFLCLKRSTLFRMGEDILNDLLFAVMLDEHSRESIISADISCYIL